MRLKVGWDNDNFRRILLNFIDLKRIVTYNYFTQNIILIMYCFVYNILF